MLSISCPPLLTLPKPHTTNSRDVRTLTQASVRALIGVVPQDTCLFNDTLVRTRIYLDKSEYTTVFLPGWMFLLVLYPLQAIIFPPPLPDILYFIQMMRQLHNIKYGRLDATMAEVEAAVEVSHHDHFRSTPPLRARMLLAILWLIDTPKLLLPHLL